MLEKKITQKLTRWFWICSCPPYVFTLFYVVFFSGRRPSPSLASHSIRPRLEPFTLKWYLYTHGQDVSSVYLDVVGNVFMFVPFALFLYIVFHVRRFDFILFFGFLFSLGIEVTQYITGVGFPDVDDVIFNTFGVLLGIIIIKGVSQVIIADIHKIS